MRNKDRQPPAVGPFGELEYVFGCGWRRRLSDAGRAFLASRPAGEPIRLALTKCGAALARWRDLFGDGDEWEGVATDAWIRHAITFDPKRGAFTTRLVLMIRQALHRACDTATLRCRDVRRTLALDEDRPPAARPRSPRTPNERARRIRALTETTTAGRLREGCSPAADLLQSILDRAAGKPVLPVVVDDEAVLNEVDRRFSELMEILEEATA